MERREMTVALNGIVGACIAVVGALVFALHAESGHVLGMISSAIAIVGGTYLALKGLSKGGS